MSLTFLVHRGKDYTVRKYLASWGRGLAARLRVQNYPRLRSTGGTVWKRLEQTLRSWRLGVVHGPPAASDQEQSYVFCDLDRLDVAETAVVTDLWHRLREHPSTARILNHPRTSMRRFELLETLYRNGRNRFAVYRPEPDLRPQRWPVFLRRDAGHGQVSRLLQDESELRQEIDRRTARGESSAEDMVVELCDVRDASGWVRKYGAFRVGDRIVPRQIHVSRDWFVRFPDIRTTETAAEELRYVEENPHAEPLRRVFELARIEYGRIDYSLVDGKIQVWEINTNPMILIPADRRDPLRLPAHEVFAETFKAALEELLAG